MAVHPYTRQPDHAFWRRCFEGVHPSRVDPVVDAPFAIAPSDRIVTAGSCFAQHIARHLREHDFNFHVTEMAHAIVPEELAAKYHYGQFSARYGNIYTTAQLLQLFKRAYGTFDPREPAWKGGDGETLDPFRPTIQPGGYIHEEEMLADRRQHLACVRKAFEELDVLVFTLGLTEYWRSKADFAAFPLCPGTAGGEFDEARYEFVNAGVAQVVAELEEFIDLLRSVNAAAKVLLTVSPVPLVATAENRHVLVSTTYSKSVLRVAADMVARSRPAVAYFPSYEIVTGGFSRGRYFDRDLRSVRESGVRHVMRLFMKHFAKQDARAGVVEAADAKRPHTQEERIAARREELRASRVAARKEQRAIGPNARGGDAGNAKRTRTREERNAARREEFIASRVAARKERSAAEPNTQDAEEAEQIGGRSEWVAKRREDFRASRIAALEKQQKQKSKRLGKTVPEAGRDTFYAELERLVDVECDEQMLDRK